MKFICCISADGYMATGLEDDMSWTPKIDKKIFQLISGLNNGICFVSKKTRQNMPKMLESRTLIEISRNTLPLGQAVELFPNSLIIGGPTLLKRAYNDFLIDDLIVNVMNTNIKENLGCLIYLENKYKFPFEIIKGIIPSMSIDFGEITTNIYRLKRYNNEAMY